MGMQRAVGVLTIVVASGAAATLTAQQSSIEQKRIGDPDVVTVTGCVQPETAVLKRNPMAGTVGMSDEYVVTSATLNPGAGTDLPKPDVQPTPEPTATSGSAGFGRVYRLTGAPEKDLKGYVGQRVEIVGRFKDRETLKDELGSVGTSGRAAEPTTSNSPEIVIDSFKPAAGACTPIAK